jgi:hypothetical protein
MSLFSLPMFNKDSLGNSIVPYMQGPNAKHTNPYTNSLICINVGQIIYHSLPILNALSQIPNNVLFIYFSDPLLSTITFLHKDYYNPFQTMFFFMLWTKFHLISSQSGYINKHPFLE